ncbi:putative signal transducing protein [Acanthopleuribacter pedis]|uniref:DUF2007 domain-containing protein n=1 Tax=Acanthopleuribacter pedis TaxID=442870 RepID=A0A8J7U567_9BACT|nr:DUF2007 domain-containing protein [Acanthopleuribacter pedis]MBO1322218.1 DUF2007 domain-containing protein [Acanthopleuribacter pedis]
MHRIHATNDFSELRYLQSLLEAKDIEYFTKDEHLMGLGTAAGEVPPYKCPMEIYVVEKDQVNLAKQLVRRATGKVSIILESWTCSSCGEQLEGQFNACWQCANARYPSAG